MMHEVAKMWKQHFRKEFSAGHLLRSYRWGVGRTKNYWDIPQGLMSSIDNSQNYNGRLRGEGTIDWKPAVGDW